jgi:hypothetical protein
MTKLQMQAAGQEDAASQVGANAASILCTRTSFNENLVRHVNHLSITQHANSSGFLAPKRF